MIKQMTFEEWAERECLPLAKYDMNEGNYVFLETVTAFKAWNAATAQCRGYDEETR